MLRKILSGILLFLSSLLLIAGVAGIVAAWVYNEPLTREATTRLGEVDATLAQVQSDLQNARAEVERALRITESVEKSLASLAGQASDAKSLLDDLNSTLDEKLIPSLQSTRGNISQVRATLEDLRAAIEQLNALPFVELNIPGDELLADILSDMDTLDSGLANIQDLAQRASTFVSDTSYVLGGDFEETKQHLLDLRLVLDDYDRQITDWRAQVGTLIASLPGWIDRASALLTIFLLWFTFSQFGLILHGLTLWRGGSPLEAWKKKRAD